MAKKTVLEIVQEILSDIDGDFVNSITDTEEAEQVANIVRSTYQSMMSNRNWPHMARTVNLTPSGDNERPTHMTIEENIKELISVYYDARGLGDTKLDYREVKWKEPDDFLRYVYGRNSDGTNTVTVDDPSGVRLLIENNKAPSYFTSFDDNTLIFDSWDSEVDSTLQAVKSLARAFIMPEFSLNDTHIPDLPEEAFTALIEEAKSRSSYRLKQQEDVKAEQDSGRQSRWLARKAWRAKGGVRYPDYGRQSRRGRAPDPTFRRN